MKFSEFTKNDTNVFIDECEEISCLPENYHSSIPCHNSRQEHELCSLDNKSLSPSEYIYDKIVKAMGNNKCIEEKRLLKRASWGPNEQQQTYGLPPTGKQNCADHLKTNKISNRVRMRSKSTRNYQLEQPNRMSLQGPVSYSEKNDQFVLNKVSNQVANRNGSLSNERRELSPSSSLSSIDSILQNRTRSSPSFDNNDLISDTSTASSLNTITSLTSILSSRQKSPIREYICSPTTRSLLREYQQKDLNRIDCRILSPVLNTNTIAASSTPISSLPSSSFSSPSSSSSSTYLTCPKGHGESPSSPSPVESTLNQCADFTLQTPTTDASLDDSSHPTTPTKAHSLMNMSMSSNRYNNQTYSSNPIMTSIPPMTNSNDGLKQQQEQIKSIAGGSCLKSQNKPNNNNNNKTKKSVHFDWHSPKEIRSISPSTHCNYRPSVTVTSSSLSTANIDDDNDIQTKKNYGEKVVEQEKEKIETTRRTINATSPLSTNTIHRSFSLSPSPFLKEENNDGRRHRQEKKENVEHLNCTTTTSSGRATTAATHLHYNTNAATVTFNDGKQKILPRKEPNGMNSFNTNGNLTYSSVDKQMPLNSLLVKTSTLNPPATTTKKTFMGTGGFFSFINRSNNSNQNNSSSNNENNQLKRTSSTQQKSKQHNAHANKRLSADIDALRFSSSISASNLSREDIEKVTKNYHEERQSTTDNNTTTTTTTTTTTNSRTSSNTNSSIPLCTNTKMNRSSTSMSMNPTTITVKSDEGDSLNNGLLFQPVHSIEREPFFLSPSKSLPNNDESSSPSPSIGKMMQTSTLIISNPPQYHYYLYPPSLPSSSSSSSSSISKKNLTTNRSISNVSMNSISTNSTSSNTSYESQTHDSEDDIASYSINNQNKFHHIKSISNTKPVMLSDSVQAFWPPPSVLKNSPEQILMSSTAAQNKHSNSIKHKQSESVLVQNNIISSPTYNNDSSSINNRNQTDALPPTTSLLLNNKQEARTYSEKNSFTNGCLRIAAGDTSLEDTQASYSERLREKSRSIKTTNQLLTMNINNSLSRSRPKDLLDNQFENANSPNRTILRPKPVNQVRVQTQLSPIRQETAEDFQSKRQFFENRTYADYTPTSTNNKTYTILPTNTTVNNNNYQNYVTK
ncbi:unnamed protein product [Rotaria magnacalcarata]|uniref:Uncharacterized protein n=1 Tax=Rotaria magnacalcarata TaxID=392030 RepID=A0A816CT88_9BILA|nr:unnamed protein product [Rotaria magnacalcarata]CAF3924231.1 unnamed protein product [Rotaria magnacalcarata]